MTSTCCASTSTVAVVDDDPAARDSLCFLLRAEGFCPRSFASAEAFLGALDGEEPACILTDLMMPGMDGVELIRTLKRRGNAAPAIVLTASADVGTAVAAMKAGAIDLLEKPYEAEAVLKVVSRALDGAGDDPADVGRQARRRIQRLTPRERQVMDLVVKGANNRQVSEKLGISARTVEIYRSAVMHKMMADSLADLVRLAVLAEG